MAAGRYRDALRQRDFRLLVVAFLIDAIGGWASSVVLAVYVYDRAGQTAWIAGISAARWVPGLLFAPSSAVFAVLLPTIGTTNSLLVIGVGFSGASVLGLGPLLRADRKAVVM